jgi:hypothetical protein
MDYSPLKQRHRGERNNHPHHLSPRLYRALSGLHLAESCENDLDDQFTFLWLAFNAAYEQDLACLNVTEAATFSQFVTKICDVDHNQDLTKLIWDVYPSSIRLNGVNLLVKLVPIINMMMDSHEALWREANYPLVE